MPRNRIIYQSLGLYASQVGPSGSQTGANTIKEITRVQSFNSDFSRDFTPITQYGNISPIDRVEASAPTVNASTEYYITDGGNESYLGLTVTTGSQSLVSCMSGILTENTDVKNLYLIVVEKGFDASDYTGGTSGVIGIGNASINNYTVNAAVGDIPTASVDWEALNFRVYADADGTNTVPAINPDNGASVTTAQFVLPKHVTNNYSSQVSALRQGDISVTFSGGIGFVTSDLKLQSFSISVDLARTAIQKLGSRFPYAREVDLPLDYTVSLEAIAGDLQDDNLADLLCQTGNLTLIFLLRSPNCSGIGTPLLRYEARGLKLVSENFSSSIGDNASVSFEYAGYLSAANDSANGIFISGTYQ